MNYLYLQWGNTPHFLTFTPSLLAEHVIATLTIVKTTRQEMRIEFKACTISEIERAWAAQGRQWEELTVIRTDKKFEALRVIWLPNGHCLQWHVLHIQDRPYDSFSATKLTKEVWEASR